MYKVNARIMQPRAEAMEPCSSFRINCRDELHPDRGMQINRELGKLLRTCSVYLFIYLRETFR